MIRYFFFLVLFVSASLVGVSHAQEPMRLPPHPVFLTIDTDSGPVRYIVEIADDPPERQRGLMFRTDLPSDTGMLFDFKTDRSVAMWMENTPLPLDMLFIRRDGTIANIRANTTPFSRATLASAGPVRFVLELHAGDARKNGLRAGMKVSHPRIKEAASE